VTKGKSSAIQVISSCRTADNSSYIIQLSCNPLSNYTAACAHCAAGQRSSPEYTTIVYNSNFLLHFKFITTKSMEIYMDRVIEIFWFLVTLIVVKVQKMDFFVCSKIWLSDLPYIYIILRRCTNDNIFHRCRNFLFSACI
jgi:hypothetical protein